jgi:hypothetical protein
LAIIPQAPQVVTLSFLEEPTRNLREQRPHPDDLIYCRSGCLSAAYEAGVERDIVVDNVRWSACAVFAKLYAANRCGAERVCSAQIGKEHTVQPQFFQAGRTRNLHMNLYFVPLSSRHSGGACYGCIRNVVLIANFGAASAGHEERQNLAASRCKESHGVYPASALAYAFQADSIVDIALVGGQPLVCVARSAGTEAARRINSCIDFLLLNNKAAARRPLRQVTGLEAVAEQP